MSTSPSSTTTSDIGVGSRYRRFVATASAATAVVFVLLSVSTMGVGTAHAFVPSSSSAWTTATTKTRVGRTAAIATSLDPFEQSRKTPPSSLSLLLSSPSSFSSSLYSSSSSSSKSTTTTRLYHMGHSHSHHHHHDHRPITNDNNNASSSMSNLIPSKGMMIRKVVWIVICWCGTVGLGMWRQNQRTVATAATATATATSRHWTTFLIASSISWVLTGGGAISSLQQTIQNNLERFRSFYSGLQRHHGGNSVAETVSSSSSSSSSSSAATTTTAADYATLSAASREADRVTWIGVVINLLLSMGKLVVGVTQHSSALIADAGHSLSDLVSDFITLWSVSVARLPPDEDHPYGHSKFEAIGSLFLSLTLLATAASVGFHSNQQLLQILAATKSTTATATAATASSIPLPGPLALVMAGLSIFSKEWLFRITRAVGQKLNSPVVLANAWHHRSDAYSSILALGSIAFAMCGFPAADAAAGMLVAVMIGTTGGDILIESVQQLSDSANEGLQSRIDVLLQQLHDDDVVGVTSIRARTAGSTANVDVIVETSPDLSTTATRAVEERVRQYLILELTRDDSSDGNGGGQLAVTATVHAKPNLELGPPCPLLLQQNQQQQHTEENLNGGSDSSSPSLQDPDTHGHHDHDHLDHDHSVAQSVSMSDSSNTAQASVIDSDNTNSDEDSTPMSSSSSSSVSPVPVPTSPPISSTTTGMVTGISAAQVEHQVRQQALLMYPKINSIQGVTVHYSTPTSVTVDVNIHVDLTSSASSSVAAANDEATTTVTSQLPTIEKIQQYALELKESLESQNSEITQARIYLDLNNDSSTTSMRSTTKTSPITTNEALAP